MRLLTGVSAILISALIGWAPAVAEEMNPQAKLAVIEFLNRHADAVAKKDIKAVMELWAPDKTVLAFGSGPGDRFIEPHFVRRAYEEDFAGMGKVSIRYFDTHIAARGDVAWFATAEIIEVDHIVGSVEILASWSGVLEKRDGKWLMVMSHFSTPQSGGK
ncbi:MAG: nuclear transport factor 2 family protein [Pseudomonadota bacterium]